MKKITKLMALAIGLIALPFTVNAEASFEFDCDAASLGVGGTTNCTIELLNGDLEGVSDVQIEVTELKHLTINSFKENNAAWSIKSQVPSKQYLLKAKDEAVTTGDVNLSVGNFDVKLGSTATANDCGSICVKVSYTIPGDDALIPSNLTGTRVEGATTGSQDPSCEDITVDGGASVGNPSLGSFADYAVLIGAGAIAVGAILLASKKSKFYRV